jgi:hypothetical protein
VTLLVVAILAAEDGGVPEAWSTCTRDADCTFVSLGCCDTTPVNQSHAKEAQERLDSSGRPFCAPKAACGPSADGTWRGARGRCVKRRCVMPR